MYSVCARAPATSRDDGASACAALGLGKRGVLAAEQHQQPRVVDVSERVRGIERERAPERLLGPIPVPVAAELRQRQLACTPRPSVGSMASARSADRAATANASVGFIRQ